MKKVNLLSKAEMKKVMGGLEDVFACKKDSEIGCSTNGGGTSDDQCCAGLVCEMNGTGTGTGTICSAPREA